MELTREDCLRPKWRFKVGVGRSPTTRGLRTGLQGYDLHGGRRGREESQDRAYFGQ